MSLNVGTPVSGEVKGRGTGTTKAAAKDLAAKEALQVCGHRRTRAKLLTDHRRVWVSRFEIDVPSFAEFQAIYFLSIFIHVSVF